MATFGPPFVNTANLADGSVTTAKIALDTIIAADVAANAIGDSEIAAHTTTKITSPFSLVTGTVPVAQGGTGQTTQTPAFDALSPLTTAGDVLTHNGTDNIRLPIGAGLQVLRANSGATALEFAAPGGWFRGGQTVLGANATSISVTGLTASAVYLIIYEVISSTVANDDITLQFNGDTAGNYSVRFSLNNAADTTRVNAAGIYLNRLTISSLAHSGYVLVSSSATREKHVQGISSGEVAAGAGTAPNRTEIAGKWANTAAGITSVQIVSSRDMVSGSRLSVYQIAD